MLVSKWGADAWWLIAGAIKGASLCWGHEGVHLQQHASQRRAEAGGLYEGDSLLYISNPNPQFFCNHALGIENPFLKTYEKHVACLRDYGAARIAP